MRFRQNQVGVVGDIKKMYNQVRKSEFDGHTHKLLRRDLDIERKLDHYMLKTYCYKPGGAIAMLALRKTAQMDSDYPLVAKMMIEDSYVDVLCSVKNRWVYNETMWRIYLSSKLNKGRIEPNISSTDLERCLPSLLFKEIFLLEKLEFGCETIHGCG